MKAKLHLTPELKKAVDEYVEEKIKDIESRANEAVMKSATTLPPALSICVCWRAIR